MPSVAGRVARSREAGEAETIEEAARELRYECFAGLIAEGHADSVLTAHTLDDQAETVVMKLLRGAWTEGLSGIHPVVHAGGREQGRDAAGEDCAAAAGGAAGRAGGVPARAGADVADGLVERGRGVYAQPRAAPSAADPARVQPVD